MKKVSYRIEDKKDLRVLHVITGLRDGGAEAILYRICANTTKYKHIVVSLSNMDKYGPYLSKLNIPVYALGISSVLSLLPASLTFIKIVRRFNPNVMQTWMYHSNIFGGLLGKLLGVKNIYWGIHHTILTSLDTKKSTIFISKLNIFLSYIIPKQIIYCAESAKITQEKKYGYSSTKGVVIYNGYDVNEFSPSKKLRSQFRREIGIDESTFLVGHVGRYSTYKDYKTLIHSFSLLVMTKSYENINFLLVGTDLVFENKELVELINSHGLLGKVLLFGPRSDIPMILNGIDLFVLTSISEAFPNVLSEAMACGIPCISTNVGDAGFILGDTGWTAEIKDSKGIALSIEMAIHEKCNDQLKWLQRKKECRIRIVQYFNIGKMVEGYVKLWENCPPC